MQQGIVHQDVGVADGIFEHFGILFMEGQQMGVGNGSVIGHKRCSLQYSCLLETLKQPRIDPFHSTDAV